MSSGKRIPQLRFGGWYSYQEWADNGFMPKPHHAPKPEPPPDPDPAPSKALPENAKKPAQPAPPPRPRPVDLYPAPPTVSRPDEPLIRPYVLTGGRTRPRHDLAVHALVRTTQRGRKPAYGLPAEHAAICRLCRTPQSVAEVAALLRVPLGVARVLVDDMESQELITITAPGEEDGQSVEILTRVLEGLRRL
jgi:hypothetical protein